MPCFITTIVFSKGLSGVEKRVLKVARSCNNSCHRLGVRFVSVRSRCSCDSGASLIRLNHVHCRDLKDVSKSAQLSTLVNLSGSGADVNDL